ncbi:type II toxin-antitoxin system RelE/ParE family toxin [Chloroflexi bacterium TSY]|nr:type II toxin-antitoxin system RelE/ParE family toxin [Chloroflexi bacterium TSY]
MAYRLRRSKVVKRQIDRLPGNVRQRVRQVIRDLAKNPRPDYAEELRETLEGCYKIKIDNWRIIYEPDDDLEIIMVLRVMRRGSKTYEGL